MAKRRRRTYRFVVPVFAIVLAVPLIPESQLLRNVRKMCLAFALIVATVIVATSIHAANSSATAFPNLHASPGGTTGYTNQLKHAMTTSHAVTVINDVSFNTPTAITSDNSYVWVTNQNGGTSGNGSVSKINIATGAVTEIASSTFDDPDAITSDGTNVWVASDGGGTSGNGSVSKINIATGAVTEIASSTFIDPFGISSDGTNVWVANNDGGTSGNGSVSKINIATGAVTEIDSSTFNTPVGIVSNGTDVWVANQDGGTGGNGSVSELDVATGAVTEINSPTFNYLTSIAVDNSNVWAANLTGGETGSVSKINIATGAVTAVTSSTFNGPNAVASNGTDVWVANLIGGASGNGSLSEVNIATGATTETDDPSFSSPVGITLTGSDVWVANQTSGTNGVGSVSEIVPSSSTSGIGSTSLSVPKAPTALHATVGTGSATLTWVAPSSDGGSAISSYVVTSQPGGKSCTTTNTSCTVTGLTGGVSYVFTVVAMNQTGVSPKSVASNKVTPGPRPATGNETAPGQPPGTRIPLRYSLPADVDNLTFHVGQTVPAGISYCLPAPNVDFGECGGSPTKDQLEPYGGVKVDGPYHFTLPLETTFPHGLLIHPNGALTGTVDSTDEARTYPFTICVSEVGVGASRGNTDTVCRNTRIVITPKAPVYPYDGIWTGGTFVGSLMTTTTPGENADYGSQPVTTTSAVSIEDIYLGIYHGSIQQFTGSGTDGTFDVEDASNEIIDPQISASGLVTGLALSASVDGVNFTGCLFSLQFQTANTATSVTQLSCQGSDAYGTPATLTGTFTLDRS